MIKDKKAIKESFDRFLIQTAREHKCHDDEIAVIIYYYLKDTRYF